MFPIPLAFFNEFQSESMTISYFNGEDCGVGMGDGDGGGDGGWGRHLNFPPPPGYRYGHCNIFVLDIGH